MSNVWQELFGNELAYFDGGMGTLLQSMGLEGGERPESWNLKHPQKVQGIHRAYLEAGARVITANTFGATRAHLGTDAEACMKAGVQLAKAAVRDFGQGWAAVDMSSLGRLPEPYGDMPFEEAVEQFRDAFLIGIQAGGDILLIETMTDLTETRACALAAKEAMERAGVRLPLFVSMTFDLRGRLLSGADIPGTAAMLAGLGADAIGLNCGHQPEAVAENVKALLAVSPLPVFVSPNASLPVVKDGRTVYPTGPEEFARSMAAFADWGAWGLGGCCGTTPEHIAALVQATRGKRPAARAIPARCIVSGRSQSVVLGENPLMIGERLNPTGKKRMKQALREGDMDYLLREAIAQADAGAAILDVNVGLPEIDEPKMLKAAVQAVQTVCDLPLQLDSGDPVALEAALRGYAGKPLINSVCGKQSVMDALFPLAARYGGALVALTLDEDGIPATMEGRLAIARRIIEEAARYGIPKSELLFDGLTMTVATDSTAARVTLDTVRALHDELGVKTVLGVSNVSFGLPKRPLLTGAFLAMAIDAGLDAAILNPEDSAVKALFDAAVAVCGKDKGFGAYLAAYGGESAAPVGPLGAIVEGAARHSLGSGPSPTGSAPAAHDAQVGLPPDDPLCRAIVRGVAGDAAAAVRERLADGGEPLSLIEKSVMPALSQVGDGYEHGKLFLPQLLQSADAAQAAFEVLRAALPEQAQTAPSRRIVLATVKGDVHDIGKNIVKVLLRNYGFAVIDLGKDVPPEAVAAAVREQGAKVAGLSALMTTTVPAMAETVALLHRTLPGVKVLVGGAVLNEEYARQLQADGYAKDAMAAVRVCQEWAAEAK